MDDDQRYMDLALAEARAALGAGDLPIGAVIVHDGRVIAAGRNAVDSQRRELAHAELVAIAAVEPYLFDHKAACTLYTTLEPCLMCYGAIVHYHFARLVVAAPDPTVGAFALAAPSPYFQRRGPAVTSGVGLAQSQALLAAYVARTGGRAHLLP